MVDEAAYKHFLTGCGVVRNLLNLVVELRGTARLEEIEREMDCRRQESHRNDSGL